METSLLIKNIPIPKENIKAIKNNEKKDDFNKVLNKTKSNKKIVNHHIPKKNKPYEEDAIKTPVLLKKIIIPKKSKITLIDEESKNILKTTKKQNKNGTITSITKEINEILKAINDTLNLKITKKSMIKKLKKLFPNKDISLKKIVEKNGSISNLIEVSDKNKKILIPINKKENLKNIEKKFILIKHLPIAKSKNNKKISPTNNILTNTKKLKNNNLKEKTSIKEVKDKFKIKNNSEKNTIYFVIPKDLTQNNSLNKALNIDISKGKNIPNNFITNKKIQIQKNTNLKKIFLKISKNTNFNKQKKLKNETTLNFIKNDLLKNNSFNSSILTLKNYKFKSLETPKRSIEKDLKTNNLKIDTLNFNNSNINKKNIKLSNLNNVNSHNKKISSNENIKIKKMPLSINKFKIKHEIPQINLNLSKSNNKISNENIKILPKQPIQNIPLEKFNTKVEEVLNKNITQNMLKESISMKITPPEIGKINVEIIKNGKAVTINILTETENAKNTLSKTLHSLVGNLRDNGYNPVTVKVDSQQKEDLMQQEKDDQQNQQEQKKREEKEKTNTFESLLRGEENA
ncbi:hypothetical protein OSSY52_22860 [Tepiditoga spiralis]|uniref:Flagellar hook-length control protein-like C-terminal domain-containing protein n=1 Tax=Tepiditoga spiralis TaxID=2108365 RepID=A0A7G1G7G6_9BACT|nr:flagellar hook-length control protein FliK [Tepiditoga spiralis]BBE32145.1 hypothetical protein OSSY52_22860 [Tepiditoga spiralis]